MMHTILTVNEREYDCIEEQEKVQVQGKVLDRSGRKMPLLDTTLAKGLQRQGLPVTWESYEVIDSGAAQFWYSSSQAYRMFSEMVKDIMDCWPRATKLVEQASTIRRRQRLAELAGLKLTSVYSQISALRKEWETLYQQTWEATDWKFKHVIDSKSKPLGQFPAKKYDYCSCIHPTAEDLEWLLQRAETVMERIRDLQPGDAVRRR